jgi:hypothetical protein
MKTFTAGLGLLILSAAAAFAQRTLSKQDVIKLAKAGLSEEFVIDVVNQQGTGLSSDVSSLIELKNAGVSEPILSAIIRKNPSPEMLNTDSVVRLVRADFSENFILDLLKHQPGSFSVDASRIVELKRAGVGERILSRLLSQSGERILPPGSEISVRLIDGIDSERDNPGKEFQASLEEPIMIGNEAVAPKRADATVRLTAEKDSGKLTGKTELKVELVAIRVNGQMVPVTTSAVTEYSNSRTARTAKSAAAVGAIGAIIGAIAGGGKGAAIGAGAGAAAGSGAQVFMKGQRVTIPPETLLTFTTQDPVKIP